MMKSEELIGGNDNVVIGRRNNKRKGIIIGKIGVIMVWIVNMVM